MLESKPNVKFCIYLKGILDYFSTYFYHPIIIYLLNIYILKSPYIIYNLLAQIITFLIL
jgi:hypothetical protein